MKKDIRIAFFDIDGTLIPMDQKDMSEKTKQTLRKLKENGIKICLATGRGPVALPHFDGIEFDLFLTYNGSYCYDDKGETIYSHAIPTKDVQRIIENATKMNRSVTLATKDRTASNGKDQDLVDYSAFADNEVHVADDFDEVAKTEVFQLMMGARKDDYSRILENVENATITSWWYRAVDIIPTNSGKGPAIEKVLEHYGLDRSQAIAFGDGNNDIQMLEAVGTGVAMENASDDLKAVADEICRDVAEDGVYQYCLENGLIK